MFRDSVLICWSVVCDFDRSIASRNGVKQKKKTLKPVLQAAAECQTEKQDGIYYAFFLIRTKQQKQTEKKKSSSSFNTQAQQDVVFFLTGALCLTAWHLTAYCYRIQHTVTPPTIYVYTNHKTVSAAH